MSTKSSEKTSEKSNHPDRHVVVNASGHEEQLERIFTPWSIYGYAVTTGNTWIASGGSIVVAIYNGGPPGVIYEFIAVSVFYWFVAASIAELASAIPSSTGVYQWATVAAGRHGRLCGWFAGWWNFFAWLVCYVSLTGIVGSIAVSLYGLSHPEFVASGWEMFVAFAIWVLVSSTIAIFANRTVPAIEFAGGVLVLVGVLVTIVVCAVMPSVTGSGYAPHDFVWKSWTNSAGYSSNGFVFVAGMLNGAFSVGTPDLVSHMAEEIPKPSRNIPKAILVQFAVGFVTALCYLITILYGITDLDSVFNTTLSLPLAEIYRQATGSVAGAQGLLVLILLPSLVASLGALILASRILWTIAREDATPFSKSLSQVHDRWKVPRNSIVTCTTSALILGATYAGSKAAFSAIVGSFVVLSTLSYLCAILAHLLSRRSNIKPGRFWMSGPTGFIVNAVACLYMAAFIVIFCFPFSLPVTAENMNYAVVITGGLTVISTIFWFWKRKTYVGPRQVGLNVKAEDIVYIPEERSP